MLYGAPVWIGAMEKKCNQNAYSRVQRLMNIKMAKAYRTTSSEALCILTGTAPIQIKAETAAKIYRNVTDKQDNQVEQDTRAGQTR